MSELKPCPWNCGKPSEITKMVTLNRWSFLHRCAAVGPITFTCATEEECALAWNTRPRTVRAQRIVRGHPSSEAGGDGSA